MLQLGQLVQAMQLTLFYQCFPPPCSSIIILVTILYKDFYLLLLIFIKKIKNSTKKSRIHQKKSLIQITKNPSWIIR